MSLATQSKTTATTTTPSSKRAVVGQTGPGHPASVGSFPSFSTVNFYAGNRLNRMSWLRQSSDFLNGVLVDDATRFIVLQHLNPLVHGGSGEQQGMLATLAWKDVRQAILDSLDAETRQRVQDAGTAEKPVIFGPQVHGVAHSNSHKHLDAGTHDKVTQAVGPTSLALVFLGMDESNLSQESMPGQMAQKAGAASSNTGAEAAQEAGGVPYFALSLSYRPPGTPADVQMPVERLASALEADGKYDFVDTRALAQAGTWPLHDAAMVAQARSLIDWNERQQFCPSCGRRQYSLWAGWKRACASSLGDDHAATSFVKSLLSPDGGKPFAQDGRGTCLTTKTLSNFCYPRTDPTVIMAIVSPDGERILLGRQKKWPPGFYSCLAGFLEPGESLEEAVRREIYEESGVQVGKVTYHSSQPWPFPANLMMGAIGQAVEGKDAIRLDLDNELEDARFFTRAEVLDVLAASSRFTLSRRDVARMDDTLDRKRIEEEERRRAEAAAAKQQQQQQSSSTKWDEKDSGSVANVTQRRGSSSSSSSHDGPLRARPAFRIPGSTAIAHVLISAWARGEAHFPPDPFRGKM